MKKKAVTKKTACRMTDFFCFAKELPDSSNMLRRFFILIETPKSTIIVIVVVTSSSMLTTQVRLLGFGTTKGIKSM